MARNPIKKAAQALTSRYASKASEEARASIAAAERSQRDTAYGSRVPGRAGAMIRGGARLGAEEAERRAANSRRNARNARRASRFA